MLLRVAILLLVPFGFSYPVSAATYFVSTSGDDSNAGSEAQPWRTIQKAANTMVAGDSVLVSPGNYGETVKTTASGTKGDPITFRADPANDPSHQVITRAFRVMNRHIVIEGFNITGASDANNAAIRIDYGSSMDGSECVVTNNTIRDGVFLISQNTDFGSNYVHIAQGDFNRAGFIPGSLVFFGSDSLYTYTNHDTKHTVAGVSADGKYLYVTDTLKPDPGSDYWAVIYAGQDNSAFKGILVVLGSVAAPTNCVIARNTCSNLFGANIVLNGSGHTVANNRLVAMHGWPALQIQAANVTVKDNLFLDSPNVEYFTPQEASSIEHPIGGNYYDFQSSAIGSFSANSSNCVVVHNWFQNCANQLALIQQAGNSFGFLFQSNVFVGMPYGGSFSRSGIIFDHNTFYRDAFDMMQAAAFGAGGRSGVTQTDLTVTFNAFINIGSHYHPGAEGYFNLGSSSNYNLQSNFCTAAEIMGWSAIASTVPGILINGGDPVLVDVAHPLGPDGLPFTDDDGLRPLPNSPLAFYGLGGLMPVEVKSGLPIAHFTVSSPTGWFDATDTSFDPAWAALKPHQRTNNIRPWETPEALGAAPVFVTFSARNSIDGLSTQSYGNAGIIAYQWDFGDGTEEVTAREPAASHTFAAAGQYWVTLTVTNTVGGWGSYSNAYRVLPTGGALRPLAPPNVRAVPQK